MTDANSETTVANPPEVPLLWHWMSYLGRRKDLKLISKWMMIWIVQFMQGHEQRNYPGTQRMASICGSSLSTIRSGEQQLRRAGLVEIKKVRKNEYAITKVKRLTSLIADCPDLIDAVISLDGKQIPIQEPLLPPPIVIHSEESSESPMPKSDEPKSEPLGEMHPNSPGAKQKKLTDPEKILVCTSIDSMVRYLLYGSDGLRATDLTNLRPTSSNWRRFGGTAANPMIDQWLVSHFMGFWWFRVSFWRNQNGVPMSLPPWGRLAGDMKNLMNVMPKLQLYKYINFVVDHFALIRYSIGRAGETLAMSHDTLMNSMVRNTTDSLMSLGTFELEQRYVQMKTKRQVANFGR